MTDYDNTNSGRLFKNDKKPEGSNQPDYRGEINVDGTEKQLAAWIRTSKNGLIYMSLAVSDPYVAEDKPEEKQQSKGKEIDIEDIPF
jgi:uncharacterized protein (DUF736 family)